MFELNSSITEETEQKYEGVSVVSTLQWRVHFITLFKQVAPVGGARYLFSRRTP